MEKLDKLHLFLQFFYLRLKRSFFFRVGTVLFSNP